MVKRISGYFYSIIKNTRHFDGGERRGTRGSPLRTNQIVSTARAAAAVRAALSTLPSTVGSFHSVGNTHNTSLSARENSLQYTQHTRSVRQPWFLWEISCPAFVHLSNSNSTSQEARATTTHKPQ